MIICLFFSDPIVLLDSDGSPDPLAVLIFATFGTISDPLSPIVTFGGDA